MLDFDIPPSPISPTNKKVKNELPDLMFTHDIIYSRPLIEQATLPMTPLNGEQKKIVLAFDVQVNWSDSI